MTARVRAPGELARFAAELTAAALLLPLVAVSTRFLGPRPLVSAARALGARSPARGPKGRGRLRRAIAVVDARISPRSRCYRRALVEMALDRGASSEPLHLGIDLAGGEGSGHAWLASTPPDEGFDVVVVL